MANVQELSEAPDDDSGWMGLFWLAVSGLGLAAYIGLILGAIYLLVRFVKWAWEG